MRYDTVLFDLDGTLTDSQLGITRCLKYALEKLGIKGYDELSLSEYIGPPLYQTLTKLGLTDDLAKQGVIYYRERFAEKGIYENSLYPRIDSLLKRLFDEGIYIALATTKAEIYASRILEYFKVDKYFNKISGTSLIDANADKLGVIRAALPKEYKSAVMVGDRHFDIDGAKAAGIDSVAVLYGYGSRDELADCSPGALVSSVDELSEYLMAEI